MTNETGGDERDRGAEDDRVDEHDHGDARDAPDAPDHDAAQAHDGGLELSHVDRHGGVRMVDVGEKAETRRRAVAEARVWIGPAAATAVERNQVAKGNVLEVARIAGIQGAKRTSELIPLCHPLPLDHVGVECRLDGEEITILAEASVFGRTGVEMEAMTAATVAALTVYDMLKAVEKRIEIRSVRLLEKSGGRSGTFRRES